MCIWNYQKFISHALFSKKSLVICKRIENDYGNLIVIANIRFPVPGLPIKSVNDAALSTNICQ